VNQPLFVDFIKVNGKGQGHGFAEETHLVADIKLCPTLSCHQMGVRDLEKQKTDYILVVMARYRNVICYLQFAIFGVSTYYFH
jgi:hypothetical protein